MTTSRRGAFDMGLCVSAFDTLASGVPRGYLNRFSMVPRTRFLRSDCVHEVFH